MLPQRGQNASMPMIPVNTDKLKAMHTDWQAQAASRAIAVKKLRDRVADGRKTGAKFNADEVAAALAVVAEFYGIEGRVKMLEELQADLSGKAPPAGQSMAAPPGAQGTRGGNAWRLP